MADEKSMSFGSASLLVRDKSLENNPKADFYKWLEEEGFTFWEKSHGFYDGVDWIWVNINNKLIARGIPGVPMAATFGYHAITPDEFKQIYYIYKKYDGLFPLKFE